MTFSFSQWTAELCPAGTHCANREAINPRRVHPFTPGAQAAFVAAGARSQPLYVDAQGWLLDREPKDAPGVIYVTPAYLFPLGVADAASAIRRIPRTDRHQARWRHRLSAAPVRVRLHRHPRRIGGRPTLATTGRCSLGWRGGARPVRRRGGASTVSLPVRVRPFPSAARRLP
jgi:hypothetical protein